MRALHEYWAWGTVAVTGLVGLWGVVLSWRATEPGRWFWGGVTLATVVTLGQVGMGVWLIAGEGRVAGDQHVFYGITIAFVFAFAYIYRAQLARSPALYYGAFFLFVMGLCLRSIATWGMDF